jgi:hypothetical protein
MTIRAILSTLCFATGTLSLAQAVPAGVAVANENPFSLPIDGTIHYSLSASEIVQFGYYGPGDVTESSALSGNLAYQGTSQRLPFSLLFAGGVLLPNQQGQGVTTFQNIAVSQGYVTRTWIFNVSDTFSFLPQSPTTGLSGVAGVGDLGVVPISGPTDGPAGGVFSLSGDRIGNSLSGSAERQLGRATSISAVGSWSVLHFLGDSNADPYGLDTTQVTGSVALNRRLDARSSASINAVYSDFTYGGSTQTNPLFTAPNIETRGINVSYQRSLSRSLSAGVSVGPQWVSSSNSALVPSALNLAVTASLSYHRRFTTASVAYSRGVNGGSGVLPGALSDSISGGVGRPIGRAWVASLSAGYTHTSGLAELGFPGSAPIQADFNTVYGGGQVTRSISEHFSGYASYTIQDQTGNNQFPVQNALNGVSQTLGVGITFTPRSTRLGQF